VISASVVNAYSSVDAMVDKVLTMSTEAKYGRSLRTHLSYLLISCEGMRLSIVTDNTL
jgi:hypothetical protein